MHYALSTPLCTHCICCARYACTMHWPLCTVHSSTMHTLHIVHGTHLHSANCRSAFVSLGLWQVVQISTNLNEKKYNEQGTGCAGYRSLRAPVRWGVWLTGMDEHRQVPAHSAAPTVYSRIKTPHYAYLIDILLILWQSWWLYNFASRSAFSARLPFANKLIFCIRYGRYGSKSYFEFFVRISSW